jgi:hypothetical protein
MVSLSRPKEVRSQETSMPARLPATSSVERNRPRLSGYLVCLVGLVYSVCLVCLVCLVYLVVSFIWLNKTNSMN